MWADCVFQNWDDCEWQNWDDCEWDKFAISYQDSKRGTRTIRKPPAEMLGSFRRPYLEGNPSYVEDNKRYPDVALANALDIAKGETSPNMIFKQPYMYKITDRQEEEVNEFQEMKYRDIPAFLHPLSTQDIGMDTPGDIVAGGREEPIEYEWVWVRYFDNTRWTPTVGEWFDDRWISG